MFWLISDCVACVSFCLFHICISLFVLNYREEQLSDYFISAQFILLFIHFLGALFILTIYKIFFKTNAAEVSENIIQAEYCNVLLRNREHFNGDYMCPKYQNAGRQHIQSDEDEDQSAVNNYEPRTTRVLSSFIGNGSVIYELPTNIKIDDQNNQEPNQYCYYEEIPCSSFEVTSGLSKLSTNSPPKLPVRIQSLPET